MRHQVQDGTLVVRVDEPLIAFSEDAIARGFASALEARRGCDVLLLDLGGVREIDSRGIGLIIELNRRCRTMELELRARSLSPLVRRVFELFQLGRLFIVESLSDGAGPQRD